MPRTTRSSKAAGAGSGDEVDDLSLSLIASPESSSRSRSRKSKSKKGKSPKKKKDPKPEPAPKIEPESEPEPEPEVQAEPEPEPEPEVNPMMLALQEALEKLGAAETLIQTLRREVDDGRVQIAAQEEKQGATDSQLTGLRQTVARQKVQLGDRTAEVMSLNARVAHLEQDPLVVRFRTTVPRGTSLVFGLEEKEALQIQLEGTANITRVDENVFFLAPKSGRQKELDELTERVGSKRGVKEARVL